MSTAGLMRSVRSARSTSHVAPALVVASLAAGVLTLVVPGLLSGPPAMNGSAKGTALVVLGAAVVLSLADHRARSGSLGALAVVAGASAYLVYNAVLLLFATPFNRAFPAYESMLGLGLWTLVATVTDIWRRSSVLRVPAQRWAAGFVLGVVVLNLVAWVSDVVPALLAPDPRSMLDGTGLTTNPVYVQDLAVWLPALAWLGIGMWKGHAPRTALGASALTYWALEAASVAVDQWWGHHADPSSAVVSAAVVPLFVVVGVVTCWPLVTVLRTVAAASRQPSEGTR